MNDKPIRVRVKYAKKGNLRFIGHLDSQRLFERALRRSKLPLRYTQGFNKRVRINLASALPLGFTSEAEIFDFWMNEVVEPVIISDRLTRSLPLEIELLGVELVDNSLPSLQASLRASDYEIVFPDTAQTESLEKDFLQLLSKDRIEITRRNKTIDIKPMIINHEFTQSNDGKKLLKIRMSSSASANARPDDLLELLGIDPADCKIKRTNLIFEE
jgi:radical SAM-linked protein